MTGMLTYAVSFLPTFQEVLIGFTVILILVGAIQSFIYAWSLPHALIEINKYSQRDDDHAGWEMLRSEAYLPMSIIVPAFNEENTIRESVLALLRLHYPDFRVIVVNDGSSDNTAERMIDEFDMSPAYYVRETETLTHQPLREIYGSDRYPNLLFLDKKNGKKADAINAGLTCVRTPLFCVIDADSLLEPEALLKAVRPFLETSDNVIAVGGTVGIVNGCTVENGRVTRYSLPDKLLPRIQMVEYIRAFLMARLAASRKKTFTIISGAFGIFRRDIAVAVGGYDTTTVGEDMELVLKMHNYMIENNKPYSIRYIPEPVCWTEAPESFKFLRNQRIRWQRGALECLERHKYMIFNRKYGRLGMITMPTFVLVDFIGPIAELAGYLLLIIFVLSGWLSVWSFIFITGLVFSFGILITSLALVIEQDEIENFSNPVDIFRVFLTSVIENFGYRQLNSYWRMKGAYLHFFGPKATWGSMSRVGFKTEKKKT